MYFLRKLGYDRPIIKGILHKQTFYVFMCLSLPKLVKSSPKFVSVTLSTLFKNFQTLAAIALKLKTIYMRIQLFFCCF